MMYTYQTASSVEQFVETDILKANEKLEGFEWKILKRVLAD